MPEVRAHATGLATMAALAAFFLLAGDDAQAAEDPATVYDDPPQPTIDTPVFVEAEAMPLDQNVAAFLRMVIYCEHSRADAASGAAFNTFYGGSRFFDLRDHPVLTREKMPVPLSPEMCKNAGLGPGCVSSAAGAFQIIRPTWNRVRQAGSWGGYLADFSEESQVEAARRLLLEAKILPYIASGDIENAIIKAGKIWASLPGSNAKQNPKTMAQALTIFNEGFAA
jgi:muramidase (phage lysozyme)